MLLRGGNIRTESFMLPENLLLTNKLNRGKDCDGVNTSFHQNGVQHFQYVDVQFLPL